MTKTLLDVAATLAATLDEVLAEIQALAPQVQKLLADGIQHSTVPRSRQIFQQAIDGHLALLAGLQLAPDRASALAGQFHNSGQIAMLREIRAALEHVDPEKLANEEALAQGKRALATVERAPEVWDIFVGLAQIGLFTSPHLHLQLLRAFLNRPSKLDETVNAAGVVVMALGKEIIGQVVPLLGVVEAIFEIAVPTLARETQEMSQAVERFDRLFIFIDGLDQALVRLDALSATIDFGAQQIDAYAKHFEQDAGWLLGTLRDAARS